MTIRNIAIDRPLQAAECQVHQASPLGIAVRQMGVLLDIERLKRELESIGKRLEYDIKNNQTRSPREHVIAASNDIVRLTFTSINSIMRGSVEGWEDLRMESCTINVGASLGYGAYAWVETKKLSMDGPYRYFSTWKQDAVVFALDMFASVLHELTHFAMGVTEDKKHQEVLDEALPTLISSLTLLNLMRPEELTDKAKQEAEYKHIYMLAERAYFTGIENLYEDPKKAFSAISKFKERLRNDDGELHYTNVYYEIAQTLAYIIYLTNGNIPSTIREIMQIKTPDDLLRAAETAIEARTPLELSVRK